MIYDFIILDQVTGTAHMVSYPENSYTKVYVDYNESVVIPWNQALQIKNLVERTHATIP